MIKIKILYIGDKWLGSNARSLANGFRQLGHDVIHIDTKPVNLPRRFTPSWLRSKMVPGRDPYTIKRLQDEIAIVSKAQKPDLIFCFKTIHLDQNRIFDLGSMPKIHYSADDVSNPYNTTEEYLSRERDWTAIVTTKRHNIAELTARGVQNKMFVFSAYDPAWHHPTARSGLNRFDVGFLGNRRPDRVELLSKLANRYGQNMCIGGPGWGLESSLKNTGVNLSGSAYGEDFSDFVSTVTANLVLLNSQNRDRHTCRSFEVPAAGGLFVGERTNEHEELLEGGVEALFFSSEEELYDILDRAKSDLVWADLVANRGYERIISGGHTYTDRARQILNEVIFS